MLRLMVRERANPPFMVNGILTRTFCRDSAWRLSPLRLENGPLFFTGATAHFVLVTGVLVSCRMHYRVRRAGVEYTGMRYVCSTGNRQAALDGIQFLVELCSLVCFGDNNAWEGNAVGCNGGRDVVADHPTLAGIG